MSTLNKKMCLWFESNQWIYIGHTKANSSLNAILKNMFAPQRFDPSRGMLEPGIWIYAHIYKTIQT